MVEDNNKIISQKLFKNMNLQKCQGDFCNYTIVERNIERLKKTKSDF